MSFAIASAAPALRLARFSAQIRAAVERVLASGRQILGPEVESFEQNLAAYPGLPHCVGVASGTRRHYPPGLHRHGAFEDRCANLPETDLLAARTLSLPIQPEVVLGRSDRIVKAVRSCLS